MSANKEVVERVRQRFLKNYETQLTLYHQNDIKNIRENDWPIERFVLVNSNEEKALQAVIKAMQWRKSFGINDFNDLSFPCEIYKANVIVNYGRDKEGRSLAWLITKNQQSWGELETLMRQFFIYQFEKLDRQTSHQGWAYVCDSTGTGVSNVEMNFTNSCTDILQNYYPRALKYILNVELPWILNFAVKLWLAFANDEMKRILKVIKKEELASNYVSIVVLPVHLDGTQPSLSNDIPVGVKRLDQMSGLLFTSKQIEKIYSTLQYLKEK